MKYILCLLLLMLSADAIAQRAPINRKAAGTIDNLEIDISFNKKENGIIRDHVSGADLIENGGLSLVRGAQGMALECVGANTRYMSGASDLYNLYFADAIDFTVETWIHIPSIPAAAGAWIAKSAPTKNQWRQVLFDGDAGNINTAAWATLTGAPTSLRGDDATNTLVVGRNQIINKWEASTGTWSLRVNGGTPTSVIVASTQVSDTPFIVCNTGGFSLPFTGHIDHFRLWSELKTEAQEDALRNNMNGPLPTWSLTHGPATATESIPPPPPAIVAPDAPTLVVSSVGLHEINFTITPAGTGGSPTSYDIACSIADDGTYEDSRSVGTNLTPSFGSLAEGTQYWCVATATNSAGTSANSNEVTGTTDATPTGTDTYATLEGMTCTEGATHNLLTATGFENGLFRGVLADPYGFGAFAGIVVGSATAGCWWHRQWTYGPADPIQTDWNPDVISSMNATALFTQYATAFAPNLYVKMPTGVVTLNVGNVDLAALGVTRWGLYENGADVIQATDDDLDHMFNIEDPVYLVLGSDDNDTPDLTLRGTHPTDGTYNNNQMNHGLVNVAWSGSMTGDELHFRANFDHSYKVGLRLGGGAGNTVVYDTIHVAGIYDQSMIRVEHTDAVWKLHNPTIMDPHFTNRLRKIAGIEPRKMAQFQFITKIVGEITYQYGYVGAFFAVVPFVGESLSDRFVINVKDFGILENGVDPGPPHFDVAWKMDPMDLALKGQAGLPINSKQWFVRHVNGPNTYGWSWGRDLNNEATNSGGNGFMSAYGDFEVVNARSAIYMGSSQNNDLGTCDPGECNVVGWTTIRGNGVDPITLPGAPIYMSRYDTLRDGEVNDIIYLSNTHGATKPQNEGNVHLNLVYASSSMIMINQLTDFGTTANIRNNTFKNGVVTGTARLAINSPVGSTGNVVENFTGPVNTTFLFREDWTLVGQGVIAGSASTRTIQSLPGATTSDGGVTYTVGQ